MAVMVEDSAETVSSATTEGEFTCLVWLSGLSASRGLPLRFLVRPHTWVVGQVPSRGHVKDNHTLMYLSLCFSLPPPLSKTK